MRGEWKPVKAGFVFWLTDPRLVLLMRREREKQFANDLYGKVAYRRLGNRRNEMGLADKASPYQLQNRMFGKLQ